MNMVDCVMWASGIVIAVLYLRAQLRRYYKRPINVNVCLDMDNASLTYGRPVSYLGGPLNFSDFSPLPTSTNRSDDYVE